MTPLKARLAAEVFKVSHRTGEFRLRSGQTSNEYFDKYQFESNPTLLTQIVEFMTELIPAETELLGALEMGGIPIATALSLRTGLPVVFVRKEAKSYGTCKFAEGPDIRGRRVCLVEDVITTGGQVVTSANDLRSEGAIIESVICVIDRSEGKTQRLVEAKLTLHSLFTMAQLKESVGRQNS